MIKKFSLLVSLFLCWSVAGSAWAEVPIVQETIAPSGLYLKADGTLLITDLTHKAVWCQKDGIRTRLTGATEIIGVDGMPIGGYRDGTLEQALFQTPWAIVPYKSGYAITDPDNHQVRLMDTEKVSTLESDVAFNRPTGLATDGEGNLYIADTGDHCIRKLDARGEVTRYAGSGMAGNSQGSALGASFREPTGLAYADGILYVADSGNHRICQVENGWVTTLAGATQSAPSDGFYQGGYLNGRAFKAQFANPQGLAVKDGVVYVADTGNSAIRKIENALVSTVSERTQETSNDFVSPRSIVISGNHLLIGDVFTGLVLSVADQHETVGSRQCAMGARQ